jgi:hypothetical protein
MEVRVPRRAGEGPVAAPLPPLLPLPPHHPCSDREVARDCLLSLGATRSSGTWVGLGRASPCMRLAQGCRDGAEAGPPSHQRPWRNGGWLAGNTDVGLDRQTQTTWQPGYRCGTSLRCGAVPHQGLGAGAGGAPAKRTGDQGVGASAVECGTKPVPAAPLCGVCKPSRGAHTDAAAVAVMTEAVPVVGVVWAVLPTCPGRRPCAPVGAAPRHPPCPRRGDSGRAAPGGPPRVQEGVHRVQCPLYYLRGLRGA